MDHKSFETNMIDFVNRNAQAAEDIRNAHIREEKVTVAHLTRKKLIKAIIEYILWLVAIIGIQLVMSLACRMNLIQVNIAITAASLFTFVAGVRINILAIRIAKYGGRA